MKDERAELRRIIRGSFYRNEAILFEDILDVCKFRGIEISVSAIAIEAELMGLM